MKKLFAPIAAFPHCAVFMYLLGLCSLMIVHQGGRHVSVFELAAAVYLLCAMLYLLPRKVAVWVKGSVYVTAYLLAVVDMFCFYRFGEPISASFLRVCMESNSREATEALREYVRWSTLPKPLFLILALLLCHLLAARREIRLKMNGWLFAGALALCTLIGLRNTVFIVRNLVEPRTALEFEYATELPHDGGFYLPFYRLLYAGKQLTLEHRSIEKLKQQVDIAQVDSCSFTSPDIVFIIGEAYNRHHSQLYGYDKPTTPRQMALASDSSLIVFTDVVSPYHQTSMVFRMAFSLYAYGQPGDWADYPLFPQLFRKAGYQVTFITNQFVQSVGLNNFDFSGSLFLNPPVLSSSMFDHRNKVKHALDMELLADYDSLRQFKTDHNLTIFHLLGQHTAYNERFTKSEDVWHGQDYNRPDLTDTNLWDLGNYDNACLYNDKVVTAILKKFENEEAIVIYMPDHGELVFDGGDKHFGRTLAVKTQNEVWQQFEIPFWIWASKRYRQKHEAIWEHVKKAKDLPFMTDNIDQVLIYLAGISSPNYRTKDNVLSEDFDKTRKRMLMGTIDYDQVMSQPGGGNIVGAPN